MRLDHIAISAIEQVAGRLVRRLLIALVIVVLAIIAVSYFVSAGERGLTAHFGILSAQLIMGAAFVAASLIALVVLSTMRAKPAKTTTPALSDQRKMQLVMLGYAFARKGERAR